MTRIFLSYRRADSITITGRIYDHLVRAFGEDLVFKDVDDIPLGVDFRNVLQDAVGGCDVQLVIIGPEWMTLQNDRGQPRIMDPDDFVHVEVAAGLARRDVLVVPVLVRGTSMPGPADLPPALTELAYRNAATVRDDPDFARDIQKLIDHITAQSTPTRVRRKTPTPAPVQQPVVIREPGPAPARDLTPPRRRRIRPLRWLVNLLILAALLYGALWVLGNEDAAQDLLRAGINLLDDVLPINLHYMTCGDFVEGFVNADAPTEHWTFYGESNREIYAALQIMESGGHLPNINMELTGLAGDHIAYSEPVDDLTRVLQTRQESGRPYILTVWFEEGAAYTRPSAGGYTLELYCD